MLSKEYHSQKSKEWYQRTKANSPEKLAERNAYCAERRRLEKSYWISQFGSKCNHCQQSFPDCAYDFHHLDYTQKERKASALFTCSREKIAKEMEKCIMLCANCHRIEHDRLNYDAHAQRELLSLGYLNTRGK